MNPELNTKLRLAGIVKESVVDGPGFRLVVFVQGCPHRCEGCHNPETHDFDGGYVSDIGRIFEEFCKNPLLAGITFSGGEPFCQAGPLAVLARMIHQKNKNVFAYTGYTFEQLLAGVQQNPDWGLLLNETDILVDGPFLLSQKNLMLKFRGSSNQRILDVPKSLKANEAIEAV